METTFDFADLEAEVFDWEDDMLIPNDNVDEDSFRQFVNSHFDF